MGKNGRQAYANLETLEKNKHDSSNDAVLDNDIRIKAYNEILQNPGIHIKELKRRMGIHTWTLILQLTSLERHKMIRVTKNKCYSSYFPLTEYQVKPTKDTITNHNMRKIFEFVKSAQGATRKEISERIGSNQVTVHCQLKKLLEANLVLKIKDGKKARFFVLT